MLLPAPLQVSCSLLEPPDTRHQVLMLAEKETDRDRWVGALTELHRILKKNNIPDKSVYQCKEVYDSQMPIISKIHCGVILGQCARLSARG